MAGLLSADSVSNGLRPLPNFGTFAMLFLCPVAAAGAAIDTLLRRSSVLRTDLRATLAQLRESGAEDPKQLEAALTTVVDDLEGAAGRGLGADEVERRLLEFMARTKELRRVLLRDGADPLAKVDRLTSEVRQQQAAEAELEASTLAARRHRQLQ
jgi:hypothetical protein